MKPEDAVNLLDNICSQVNLSREMHEKVKEAVQSLRNTQKKKKKEDE